MANTEIKSVALAKDAIKLVEELAKKTERSPHYWYKKFIEDGVKKEKEGK